MHGGNRVEILGVGVDVVTMAETLRILDRFIQDGDPKVVVTADAAGIVAAQSDPEWKAIMDGADLVTPDSVGVLWASARYGNPISERVSGVELVEKLVAAGYRCYFLGGAPGIAEKAKEQLLLKFPNAQIVGVQNGFFSEAEEGKVVTCANKSKPQVLFVAMGIPKQEKFIAKYLHEIGAAVNMGVGGSFDVLSGTVKRAPKLLQSLRLEWLWRLIQNPKKWRKVAALPTFWWLVIRSGRRPKPN